MSAVALEDLAQRIAQQEAQLEALRREHEARQAQLNTLVSRKEELQAQLQQVESEIQAVTRGKAVPAAASSQPTLTSASLTMADLLVQLVRAGGGRPVPTRELTAEVVRRRLTSSGRPNKVVENRAYELVKQGILQRAPNRAGFLLG